MTPIVIRARALSVALALSLLGAMASCGSPEPAFAQNAQVSGLPARGTPAASDQVPVLPVGATHLQATTIGAITALVGAPAIQGTPTAGDCAAWYGAATLEDAGAPCGVTPFPAYPVEIAAPDGVAVYLTQSALGQPPYPQYGPYEGNTAFGSLTLNPATHLSAACTNVTTAFCGDETAFGAFTLHYDVTGHDNTAIGISALSDLVSGNNDTFVGSSAGANISSASFITGIGASACQNVNTATGPVICVGASSMQSAAYGSAYATAVGTQAFFNASAVTYSAGLGDAVGYNAATVTDSTVLGFSACNNVTAIIGSICVGYEAGPASGTLSNKLWIGPAVTPLIWGDLSAYSVVIGGTTALTGAALTVEGSIGLPAGDVLQWNGDTGVSRAAADFIELGNGTGGDLTAKVGAAMFAPGLNANISSPSAGILYVGTGTTAGTGGTLDAAAFNGQLGATTPAAVKGTTLTATTGVVAPAYTAGSTAGVSCAANTVSLTTLTVTAGIVTHC